MSLQSQHLVDLEVQMPWQVQYLWTLKCRFRGKCISWQVQYFVYLEVQISCTTLWTLKRRPRGRRRTLWTLKCNFVAGALPVLCLIGLTNLKATKRAFPAQDATRSRRRVGTLPCNIDLLSPTSRYPTAKLTLALLTKCLKLCLRLLLRA